MKPFRAECPLRYQRPMLEELQSRDVRPYLFGGAQRPACKNCHVAGSRVRLPLHQQIFVMRSKIVPEPLQSHRPAVVCEIGWRTFFERLSGVSVRQRGGHADLCYFIMGRLCACTRPRATSHVLHNSSDPSTFLTL